MNDEIIINDFRLKYYLNKLNESSEQKIIINNKNYDYSKKYNKYDAYYLIYILNKDYLNKKVYSNNYTNDLLKYLKLIDNNDNNYFLTILNDSVDDKINVPIITKARSLKNTNRVLLKLNSLTHYSMLMDIHKWDIPFSSKNNKLIWRGSSTNIFGGLREKLVKQFQNHSNENIDIKYSLLVQGYNNDKNEYILGKRLSYEEQLRSKFIISIEGNDVATNLKWLLLSNSVVLMPSPTVCSWFMEDQLKPFIHYIPIKSDFSDLDEKYKWCLDNLQECELISKNATKFMEPFLDEENENELNKKVLESYFKKVQLIFEEDE